MLELPLKILGAWTPLCPTTPPLPAALVWQRDVNTFRLILHPTCIIKPAVDGCPLVAANSMEIEKVQSFLLQIREKDHAAPLGDIVRVILSPLVVFPKQRPSCLFPHHAQPPSTIRTQSTSDADSIRDQVAMKPIL